VSGGVLLEARGVSVHHRGGAGRQPVPAVADVSLRLHRGEVLGLVGESGSGKTTLARTLLGIQRETAGTILLDGRPVSGLPEQRARRVRRDIQYVHQDAAATLDPWWSIGASLEEALRLRGTGVAAHGATHGATQRATQRAAQRATQRATQGEGQEADRITEVLAMVGLDAAVRPRYAHELSGGQLRRVALARTLLLEPRIIILDEPTAGLDMSVQATVLALLADLRTRLGLTYLLISHDLGVVRRFCDRIAILYAGRIVEQAPAAVLFAAPLHPYTRALLAATPALDDPSALEGVAIDDAPMARPDLSGCAYHPICPHAEPACSARVPPLEAADGDRTVACWRWRQSVSA
jgi:oligopeptide/dipeptide ABC transporter ATP-binding protein